MAVFLRWISSSRQQSLIRVKAEKPRDLLRIEQELGSQAKYAGKAALKALA